MSKYYDNLIKSVIDKSEANDWNSAVYEWEIYDCEEDESLESSCICGKENLKYLYTIKNRYNNNMLFPIGSSCIKKFGRTDLNDEISVKEKLFKLLHAFLDGERIELNSTFFSRKLLKFLYEEDVFEENRYNNFCSENTYRFLLDMFNKRNITSSQNNKIKAILVNDIFNYLRCTLSTKISK